jgi:hypothetical protein
MKQENWHCSLPFTERDLRPDPKMIPDARASGWILPIPLSQIGILGIPNPPIPAKPGFPISQNPGQIGIGPRITGIAGAKSRIYFPDPGPIGMIGKIPAIFPGKSGRDGAGFGDFGGLVYSKRIYYSVICASQLT